MLFSDLWFTGCTAALLQVAVGEFAAAAHGTQTSPMRATGRWVIDAIPTPLIDLGVALLRRADKPVIAVTLLLLSVSVSGLAGLAGLVPLVATLTFLGAIGLVALWRRTELGRIAGCCIGLLALAAGVGGAWLSPLMALAIAFALVAGVALLRAVAREAFRRLQPVLPVPRQPLPAASTGAALAVPGISPLFTAPEHFFVTDVTFPTPMIDRYRWQLDVVGLVDRPLSLTYDQLLDLPSVEIDAVLMCVHNPVGGPFIGNARWQGVRLGDLLASAGVSRSADHLRLHSVDGFSAGFSLDLIGQGHEPLLAYGMNGAPLRPVHGAPLRLLVPGIHGYDSNIKWLHSIEVTRFDDAIDYAERKGWPRVPSRMGPNCRIDVPVTSARWLPGEQVVAGVAWSPPHGVLGVELRIDGGTWHACTLAKPMGPHAWRHWSIQWRATPGRHFLEVRAWGRDGVQGETVAAPYPGGSGGYHRVEIDVDERLPPRARQFAWWLADHVRGRLRLARAGLEAWRRHRPGVPPKHHAGTNEP